MNDLTDYFDNREETVRIIRAFEANEDQFLIHVMQMVNEKLD